MAWATGPPNTITTIDASPNHCVENKSSSDVPGGRLINERNVVTVVRYKPTVIAVAQMVFYHKKQ